MKKIEEEYQEHVLPEKVQKYINNPIVLVLNIEDFFRQIRQEESFILRRIRTNHIVEFLLPRTKAILQAEEEVLREMLQLIEENLDYFIEITQEINEKNYHEFVKLMDFLVLHYVGNRSYYDAQLESVYQSFQGVDYCDYSQRNTREDIRRLVSQKIGEAKGVKQLEKKNQM